MELDDEVRVLHAESSCVHFSVKCAKKLLLIFICLMTLSTVDLG